MNIFFNYIALNKNEMFVLDFYRIYSCKLGRGGVQEA